MATTLFGGIGTALGGPVGGAIGSLVGGQIETLFTGGARPRLREGAITMSSYGLPLPRHFGRMRVGGAIIWATELVATGTDSAEPGYAANFAVAVASRPIAALGRIWADGKLLRGADGDLKVAGTLRIYTGHGDQQPDPLIAADVGPAECPAFRGLAYLVFEALDLSQFYNRVPALAFEVIADEAFGLAEILGAQADDVATASALPGLDGFSLEGPAAQGLAQLDPVFRFDLAAGDGPLAIATGTDPRPPVPLPEAAVAVADDQFGAATGHLRERAPQEAARPAALRYFASARDYLPATQHAPGPPAPGAPETIELPAALADDVARQCIARAAKRVGWARERASWRSIEVDGAVGPGSCVSLPGQPGMWRVRTWEWREGGVELGLERALPPEPAATAPRLASLAWSAALPDTPAPRTVAIAFDLPGADGDATRTAPHAALSATGAGWQGATLCLDRGDGGLHCLGRFRQRSILGRCHAPPPPDPDAPPGHGEALVVTLIDPAMALPRSGTALVGPTRIGFAAADRLGGGTWRLSGFSRGIGQAPTSLDGETSDTWFVLLDETLVALPAPPAPATDPAVALGEAVAISADLPQGQPLSFVNRTAQK